MQLHAVRKASLSAMNIFKARRGVGSSLLVESSKVAESKEEDIFDI